MRLSDYLHNFREKILAIDEFGNSKLYRDALDMANSFSKEGNGRNLVFQVCSNSIGSLLGYCAFLSLDWPNLLLTENTKKEQMEDLTKIYNPKFLWIPEDSEEILPENYKIVMQQDGFLLAKADVFTLSMSQELSVLLSTSGSTGTSKLVKLSHQNLLSNAISIAEYLDIKEDDRPITSLPMNYSYGLSVINSHIIKGATILLTSKSVIQLEFWSFFKKSEATSMAGVPYTYELLDKIRFGRMKLPSLRTMTQAGGKLSDDLIEKFWLLSLEKGYKFYVMYGQTEATARMSYVPYEQLGFKIGSIGIAIPGGKFEICNSNHDLIEDAYKDGELVYRGENVFGGYATSASDLSFMSKENTLFTGDIAHRDDDGFYFITGRLKRFVKLYGNRISLDAVEQIIKKWLNEAACSGDDNEIRIYTTDSVSDSSKGEILIKLATRLHIQPDAIKLFQIEEIPKSDSGKTLYHKLR